LKTTATGSRRYATEKVLFTGFGLLHAFGDYGAVEFDDDVFGVGFAADEAAFFDGVGGEVEFDDEGTDLKAFVGIDGGPEFVAAAGEEAGEEAGGEAGEAAEDHFHAAPGIRDGNR
jgi:hypothetical protein